MLSLNTRKRDSNILQIYFAVTLYICVLCYIYIYDSSCYSNHNCINITKFQCK